MIKRPPAILARMTLRAALLTALLAAPPAPAATESRPATRHPPSPAGTPHTEVDTGNEDFAALRDPFWPVGYSPASEAEQAEQSKITSLQSRIQWPALRVRGITHAGRRNFIAMIEGIGLAEKGDIVSIERDGLVYRWRIDSVTASGMTSTRLDVTETAGRSP